MEMKSLIFLVGILCVKIDVILSKDRNVDQPGFIISLKPDVDINAARKSLQSIEVIDELTLKEKTYFFVKAGEINVAHIKDNPMVENVETNRGIQLVRPVEQTLTSETNKGNSHFRDLKPKAEVCNEQMNPMFPDHIWGLIRTSYRPRPNFGSQPYRYMFDGEGVDIYILDTGVDFTVPDLRGRGEFGYITEEANKEDGTEHDLAGHGTNVAALAGGITYGIAKRANLISVKVLSASGASDFGIAEGLDWVLQDYRRKKSGSGNKRPSIINMSLGGPAPATSIMIDALQAVVDEGMIVVVAAGNEAEDASGFKPAYLPTTIAVGATGFTDDFADFSNYGSLVDVSAPGDIVVGPMSSFFCETLNVTVEDCLFMVSGTSQACPHVSGIVARYISSLPEADLAEVNQESIRDVLHKTASQGFIKFASTNTETPNRLLFKSCGDNDYQTPPNSASVLKTSTAFPLTILLAYMII